MEAKRNFVEHGVCDGTNSCGSAKLSANAGQTIAAALAALGLSLPPDVRWLEICPGSSVTVTANFSHDGDAAATTATSDSPQIPSGGKFCPGGKKYLDAINLYRSGAVSLFWGRG